MNDQLVQRIRACPTLPSLPAIAMQVLQLAQSPEVDLAEMARLVSKDPALSSKILKTVNSSFYGRPQHVSTVSHALVILGLQSVKTLVLGFSLISGMSGKSGKARGFDHMRYWKRSAYAATAAKVLCAKAGVVQHEEAFLSALLADIGMLVLDQVLGDEYAAVCESVTRHDALPAAELAALGMTHADVGRIMTESWKLPASLMMPVAFHHDPSLVTDANIRPMVELVGLAGRCADVFVDADAGEAIKAVRQQCLARFRMDDAATDALLAEISDRTREIATLFELNIGSTVQFEQILKRANEALVEITLQSQQQASALAQQASSLQIQNQQLKEAATTDALTGLGNRQRFDDFLAAEYDEAVRTGGCVSLIMIDLDHFKKVNDTHGHPAGDAVLRHVAKLLRTTARANDVACRYGGEEMALVMPATSKATAAATAETIRRVINAKPVQTLDVALSVSASIGVATFEPGSPLASPAHLIKAADLSLYNAKHSGRNCVKVFTFKPPAGQAA